MRTWTCQKARATTTPTTVSEPVSTRSCLQRLDVGESGIYTLTRACLYASTSVSSGSIIFSHTINPPFTYFTIGAAHPVLIFLRRRQYEEEFERMYLEQLSEIEMQTGCQRPCRYQEYRMVCITFAFNLLGKLSWKKNGKKRGHCPLVGGGQPQFLF